MQLSNVAPLNRIRANTAQSDQQIAERHIRRELSGIDFSILEQAIARANRYIRAGKCWSLSADQAVKWARCAVHLMPKDVA